MPDDPRDQLKALIDAAAPVTPDEIEAARERKPARPLHDHRRLVFAAAATVFVAGILAVAALAGLRDGEGDDGSIAETPPTVLPPPDADPLVRCGPDEPAFRYSALSGPIIQEDDPDPARRALIDVLSRATLGPNEVWNTDPGWRELARSDTEVYFASGTPPLLFRNAVTRDDTGQWGIGGRGAGHSGMCVPTLAPPEGLVYLDASLDPEHPPTPESTELHLRIPRPGSCAGSADLVGPDVVETEESVTIRAAGTSPDQAWDDPVCDYPAGEEYLPVTIELASPIGERQVFDGNTVPPRAITVDPPPAVGDAEPTEIVLAGGTIERTVAVRVDDNGTCGVVGDVGCRVVGHPAELTVIAGDETTTGKTNEEGRAVVVVPDGGFEVVASHPDLWCPPARFVPPHPDRPVPLPEPPPDMADIGITCARLDGPHAAITLVVDVDDPERDLRLARLSGPVGRLAERTGPGRYEVVLEPGDWILYEGDLEGPRGFDWDCRPATITVEAGEDRTIELTCR